ncbi:signal peptidase II [Catellicoccus marimammalium]|uniref:Lipoprotein signal peptidase n=1 Tax=Catellicoccus marimammalium M35/04/3 TaxID=1234409 RepID=K8ZL35_9ENTE|nr:signal peptidase II [Catellicoccus marimammalium]EKU27288.1 Lipoprotein signal peptidase [Catellicoccus marimammalium M35/04/3]
MVIPLMISAFVLLADQALKFWVVQHIPLGDIVGHNPVLDLTYLQNRGAAWSIFQGKVGFLFLIAFIASLVIIYLLYKYRHRSPWLRIGLGLCLGGALGNMIDRIRLGYVVDMFHLELFSFPVFNIADIALCIGVVCIMFYLVKEE